MVFNIGFFIGAVLLVWLLAAVFTFAQKVITKKVTRSTIIISTIAAGLLCFVSALFGEWEPGAAATAYIAIIIGTLVVIWIRLDILKRKAKK